MPGYLDKVKEWELSRLGSKASVPHSQEVCKDNNDRLSNDSVQPLGDSEKSEKSSGQSRRADRLPQPMGRPTDNETELRRLTDWLDDPVAFARWFERLMDRKE